MILLFCLLMATLMYTPSAWADDAFGANGPQFMKIIRKEIDRLNKIVRSDLATEEIYYARGWCHRQNSNYQDALHDFDAAVALNSEDFHNYLARADGYAKISDYERALADYRTAEKLAESASWSNVDNGIYILYTIVSASVAINVILASLLLFGPRGILVKTTGKQE